MNVSFILLSIRLLSASPLGVLLGVICRLPVIFSCLFVFNQCVTVDKCIQFKAPNLCMIINCSIRQSKPVFLKQEIHLMQYLMDSKELN